MWNHAIQSIPSEYRVIDIEVEIWLFFESACIYLLVLTSTNLEYKDVFQKICLSIHKISSQYNTVNWEGYLMNLWIRKCDLIDWKFLVGSENWERGFSNLLYFCLFFDKILSTLHPMLHTIVDDVVSCSFYINIFLVPWCVERQDSMLYMQYVCYSPIECLLLFEVPIDSIFGVIPSTTLKGFGSIYFFAYCFYWTELENSLTRKKKIKLDSIHFFLPKII